jgi:hypothetical protein
VYHAVYPVPIDEYRGGVSGLGQWGRQPPRCPYNCPPGYVCYQGRCVRWGRHGLGLLNLSKEDWGIILITVGALAALGFLGFGLGKVAGGRRRRRRGMSRYYIDLSTVAELQRAIQQPEGRRAF